jgi:surfactin synthase thioesterase subunit
MTALVRPRGLDDASLRLAVFHHAGGSATAYVPLARKLPADWDAVLIDLPGRVTRRAAPSPWDLAAVVGTLARDLLPWAGAAPLALFGHSLGATLAFETARTLHERGVPVAWVGVSGRVAPGEHAAVPWLDPGAPDEELAHALRRLGGLPGRLDEYPDVRRRFLDLIRADLAALDGYRPDPRRRPLAAPLTAFGGVADPLAPPVALAAWARQTTGPFGLRALRGGHFGLFDDEFERFTPVLVGEIRARAPAQVVVSSHPSGAQERT